VGRGCRGLDNQEPRNLYSSPNIIREIKSRRMRRAENVARTREMRNAYRILVGNLKRRVGSEDLDVDGRIILE